MRRADSRRLWAERIAAWKASGLKQQAFCEREGLRYQSFLWWRRRLRREAQDTGLMPVVARRPPMVVAKRATPARPVMPFGGPSVISDGVEIRLPSGRALALGALDEVRLRQLIRLLETLPC